MDRCRGVPSANDLPRRDHSRVRAKGTRCEQRAETRGPEYRSWSPPFVQAIPLNSRSKESPPSLRSLAQATTRHFRRPTETPNGTRHNGCFNNSREPGSHSLKLKLSYVPLAFAARS